MGGPSGAPSALAIAFDHRGAACRVEAACHIFAPLMAKVPPLVEDTVMSLVAPIQQDVSEVKEHQVKSQDGCNIGVGAAGGERPRSHGPMLLIVKNRASKVDIEMSRLVVAVEALALQQRTMSTEAASSSSTSRRVRAARASSSRAERHDISTPWATPEALRTKLVKCFFKVRTQHMTWAFGKRKDIYITDEVTSGAARICGFGQDQVRDCLLDPS